MIPINGNDNAVSFREEARITGSVSGDNNRIVVHSPNVEMHLHVNGSNNTVEIGRNVRSSKLFVYIGNHVKAHNVRVEIGDNSSFEPDCRLYLYNSGNSLRIGKACMFSNSIVVRTGESPHLIFDDETGAYLDTVGNVSIGDHCWIGERAYLTKRTSLPADTIVAACSVVTRAFTEEKTVVAGNPAEVRRRAVKWIRNRTEIPPGSPFEASFLDFVRSQEPAGD